MAILEKTKDVAISTETIEAAQRDLELAQKAQKLMFLIGLLKIS